MKIFPAIDIINGECVRLTQGDYNEVTVFDKDPIKVAIKWQDEGGKFLHIVDLDGAKKGISINDETIKKMVEVLKIPIEIGGGIRTLEDIDKKLSMGVNRVILGSAAVKNPEIIKEAILKYGPEKVVVGIDAKKGYICINGWIEKTNILALDFCHELEKMGVKYVIYTDIAKDGMMEGPNISETKELIEKTNLKIIASGGIKDFDDIKALKNINAYGVIIGKALYLGNIKIKDAQKINNNLLGKRIIPCLDVKDGRVVKGVNFINLIDAGDPVVIAKAYSDKGADEIVFLDITATHEKRKTIIDVVKKTAKQVFIPLTVGGGISSIKDIREILLAGADKVSLNSAAVRNPNLINEASNKFGNQCIVVAIDAKKIGDEYKVFINGGRINTNLDCIAWAKECESRGAGEILLTSMDADGTKKGFELDLTRKITEAINIPVIASGGAGSMEDFKNVFEYADAGLAASLFHFKEMEIKDLKEYLYNENIPVRRI